MFADADHACSLDALAAALAERDEDTLAHADRVCRLSDALARAHGLDQVLRRRLHHASRFHDIGKLGVPDAILRKPSPLDAQELLRMQRHCEQGERIFLHSRRTDAADIALAIRSHHEAWDGSGYPDGLAGTRIPLLARIVRIADSYDAMASARPYQASRPHAQIMQVMAAERGHRHDPALFDLFAGLIDGHPDRAA